MFNNTNHRLTTNALVFALGSCVGVALISTHSQAAVLDLAWNPGADISSLNLPDGSWDQGSDWGFSDDGSSIDTWANENWTGSNPVDFNLLVSTDGAIPTISLAKTVTNTTGQDWTGFRIDLAADAGLGVAVDLASTGSDAFGSVDVTTLAGGGASIIWSGGAIAAGEQAVMFTAFGVFGTMPRNPAFSISMIQSTIPSPGGLALLGMGGLLACRRRR